MSRSPERVCRNSTRPSLAAKEECKYIVGSSAAFSIERKQSNTLIRRQTLSSKLAAHHTILDCLMGAAISLLSHCRFVHREINPRRSDPQEASHCVQLFKRHVRVRPVFQHLLIFPLREFCNGTFQIVMERNAPDNEF